MLLNSENNILRYLNSDKEFLIVKNNYIQKLGICNKKSNDNLKNSWNYQKLG
jgi:hypothetical protein